MQYSDIKKITGINKIERKQAYEHLILAMIKTSKKGISGKIEEALDSINLEPDVPYLAQLYDGCEDVSKRDTLYKIAEYFANDLLEEENYKEYFFVVEGKVSKNRGLKWQKVDIYIMENDNLNSREMKK